MEYRGQQFIFDAQARLGAGGMAEVYLGILRDDPSIRVAIKIPLPDLDDNYRSLFLREADAAQAVNNTHVVHVVDWGDGPTFIAYEFIEGGTLVNELRRRQGEQLFWSEEQLINLYRQLVEAMTAINEIVIHRDLKPENIFLQDSILKVSDFGISKYVGEVTRSKTFKGWGSAPYMAPETFRGESIDWRADQYSLGVIFYEMATLQRPFTGDWEALERMHLYERPSRVTSVRKDVSERLASMIAKMLEKRAEDRWPSWQKLAAELDAIEKRLPAEEQNPREEDTLVHKAAEQIEFLRKKNLQEQQRIEEERREEKEHQQLLDYWTNYFFEKIQKRIEELNESLGDSAIRFERSPMWCQLSFINSRLQITLQAVPINAQADFMLWGKVDLTSNLRAMVSNLILLSEPLPYGTWYEVEMKMDPWVRPGVNPDEEDNKGGSYRVIGSERAVLAENWEALQFQREWRNVMSLVGYNEKLLDFEILLEQLMQVLVEDAAVPPPNHS